MSDEKILWDEGNIISPISGKLTSGFNDSRGDRLHYGGDIGAPAGTVFVAPTRLTITHVRDKMSNSPGGMVWAEDDSGHVHRFHHVQPGVGIGDIIEAGQPLGVLSDINHPHLDWKIKSPNGSYVDFLAANNIDKGFSFSQGQRQLTLGDSSAMVAGPATPSGKRDISSGKQVAISKAMPEQIQWDEDVKWDDFQTSPYLRSAIVKQALARPNSPDPATIETPMVSGEAAGVIDSKDNPLITMSSTVPRGIVGGSEAAANAVWKAVNYIHDKYVEPIVMQPTRNIAANLGIDKVHIPMITGEAAGLINSEDNPIYEYPFKEALAQTTGGLADYLTFSGIARGLGKIRDIAKAYKTGQDLSAVSDIGELVANLGPPRGRVTGEIPERVIPSGAMGDPRSSLGRLELDQQLNELDRLQALKGVTIPQAGELNLSGMVPLGPQAERLTQLDRLGINPVEIRLPESGLIKTPGAELVPKTTPGRELLPVTTQPLRSAAESAPILEQQAAIQERLLQSPQGYEALKQQLGKEESVMQALTGEKPRLSIDAPLNRALGITAKEPFIPDPTEAGSLAKFQRQPIPGQPTGDRGLIKKYYSGGPDAEDLARFFQDQMDKGLSPTGLISAAATKFDMSERKMRNLISSYASASRNQVSPTAESVGSRIVGAINTEAQKIVDGMSVMDFMKQIPSLRNVTADVPPIPIHQNPILNPEADKPLRMLSIPERKFLSPSVISRNMFPKDGGYVLDYAGAYHDTIFNMAYYRKWNNVAFNEIMDDVRASAKEGEKLIGPIFNEYIGEMKPALDAQKKINGYLHDLKDYDIANAGHAKPIERLKGRILEQEKIIEEITGATNIDRKKYIEGIMAQRDDAVKLLAQKYSNVRIKLAADGEQWAMDLLQPNEKKIVDNMRTVLDQHKGFLQEAGLPVIEKDYTHYVFNNGAYSTDPMADKGMGYYASKLLWKTDQDPVSLSTFMSRQPGSKDWFPFAYQSNDAYFGSVWRKLGLNDWRQKWVPEYHGWANSNPELATAFKQFYDTNFMNPNMHWYDGIANQLVNFEYTHLLWGNFSPMMKHLIGKMPGVIGEHGWATVPAAKMYAQALGQKMIGSAGPELKTVEYYVQTKQLIDSIMQNPSWAEALTSSYWTQARNMGNLTRITEHIDRGINSLAAMTRGINKNFDSQTINRAIHDYMLRVNFQGYDLPAHMTGDFGRFFNMFQAQPYKIWEYRANQLSDVLQGKKDIFGDGAFPKMLRMYALIGAMGAGGTMVGYDLWGHMLHAPYVKFNQDGNLTWSGTPLIDYGYKAMKQGVNLEGLTDEVPEQLMDWATTTGTPGKLKKLLDEDIPDTYSGPLSYILGIPKRED